MAKQFLGTRYQSFKNDGTVNAAGWVYFYEQGTSTEKITYSDSDLGTPNASPVVLNAAGAADIWYDGDADVSVYDSTGTLVDSYPSINPAATSALTVEPSLIANGSFEEGGTTTPSNWTRSTPPALGVSVQDTDSNHGKYSWKFTSGGNGAGSLITSNFFSVSVNRRINIVWQMKSSVADVRNLVEIVWYDSAGTELVASSIYDDSATNPTSWTTKAQTVTVFPGAKQAKLRITGCHSSDATPGSTWFDGILVTEAVIISVNNVLTENNSFLGDITVQGSLISTKTAASGYSRISPNMCRLNSYTASTALTRDAVTLVTGPTGAKGLILSLSSIVRSNNAIAERQAVIGVYSDSGGTTLIAQHRNIVREEVATVAGTLLSDQDTEVHVKCDSSYRVWLTFTDDTGNQGTAGYAILGYYD